jgi:TIR domain-containing protein
MQKTVKFLKHYPKRDGDTDNFVCGFRFSVLDTQLISTPYEIETIHKLKVSLSDELMINWRLQGFQNVEQYSDEMVKVAYQSAEEYISKLIKSGTDLEDELLPLERTTANSPKSCPYKIINITYPVKNTFVVDFDKQTTTQVDLNETTNFYSKQLKVFLCHTTADKSIVRNLYKRLVNKGVDAWLDQEKILPGQDWRIEIPKAVRNSDIVIVCLSNNSVNKEGYVQKEIKVALDIADEKLEETIFIIPARLEECDVPDRLSKYQWVDLFLDDGYDKLFRALKERMFQMRKKVRSSPP